MSFISTLSQQELNTFFKVIQDSLSVNRHEELFHWLSDEVQVFVPHDILIAAWGDFSLGLVHLDVVSRLPGLRTTEVDKQQLLPFLLELFERWVDSDRVPLTLEFNEETFHFCHTSDDYVFGNAMAHMRSALVQGIKDERGRHDCLYVAMSYSPSQETRSVHAIELLLPYIDAALRQVAHLPVQYPDIPEIAVKIEPLLQQAPGPAISRGDLPWDLSQRELEILHWVCMGKTNSEIGQILDISFFTVKNHLQRIFRKLDVLNRAQAVAKFEYRVRDNLPPVAATLSPDIT